MPKYDNVVVAVQLAQNERRCDWCARTITDRSKYYIAFLDECGYVNICPWCKQELFGPMFSAPNGELGRYR